MDHNKQVQNLEERIQYWVSEAKFTLDKQRKKQCDTTLKFLAKQYKELTGEYYGH